MSRDVGAMPYFHESGFNEGLDPAQIAKNDRLLNRFQDERIVYNNVKRLLDLTEGDFSKNGGSILLCLMSLRDHGVDFFPEIDYLSSGDFDKECFHRVVKFLRDNREALLNGTYKNDGKLVSSGKILTGDNDLRIEERVGPYVRKVMPGVDIKAGTYPRFSKRLELMITRGDGIDHDGVKIVSKGFAFMRDEFLPKLEQALQYFLSSRSEAIFAKMVEVRNGFDRVLSQRGADSFFKGEVSSAGKTQIPVHWVEEYRHFMHQINLMYAVYDKLEDAVFRLGVVVEGGAVVEAQIGNIRDRFLLPLLSAHSSIGSFASLGDVLAMAEAFKAQTVEDVRPEAELRDDFMDYMNDARELMAEIGQIVGVYMKALMHSGINETHPDDVSEIEEFLK